MTTGGRRLSAPHGKRHYRRTSEGIRIMSPQDTSSNTSTKEYRPKRKSRKNIVHPLSSREETLLHSSVCERDSLGEAVRTDYFGDIFRQLSTTVQSLEHSITAKPVMVSNPSPRSAHTGTFSFTGGSSPSGGVPCSILIIVVSCT